jgi:hypothetical protein
LFALPGAAEGGSIPLLAAESIEDEARETESVLGCFELPPLPQEIRPKVMPARRVIDNFFIIDFQKTISKTPVKLMPAFWHEISGSTK